MKQEIFLVCLFTLLSITYGATAHWDLYEPEGATVVFPMTENLQLGPNQLKCNKFTWEVISFNQPRGKTIAIGDALCNPVTIFGNYQNRANVSGNGSLLLYNVKTSDSGKYKVKVENLERASWFENTFMVYVQVPLSVPVLDVSCPAVDRAVITCWVERGSDPTYSWLSNGNRIGNQSSQWEVERYNITVTLPFDGNISCSVRNNVSERTAGLSLVQCRGSQLSFPVHLYMKMIMFVMDNVLLGSMVVTLIGLKREQRLR